ncbi:MAG: RNA polymerase sigma factor [Dehalococcoidia bacterium]
MAEPIGHYGGSARSAGAATVLDSVHDRDDDGALLARLCEQDVAALALLYDRYNRQVFGLALHMVHSPETAEEVAQETFLAVWRRAGLYRPQRGTPRAWLFSIARHRTIDVLRRQRSRPATTTWPNDVSYAGSNDTWSTVSQLLTAQDLQAALATLAPRLRESIDLAYFGGYTCSEIALRLAIPVGTVKSRLRTGLEQLHLYLTNGEPRTAVASMRRRSAGRGGESVLAAKQSA